MYTRFLDGLTGTLYPSASQRIGSAMRHPPLQHLLHLFYLFPPIQSRVEPHKSGNKKVPCGWSRRGPPPLLSGSKNDLGFAAVRSCSLPPRYVRRNSPHFYLWGSFPHSSLWSYAPHARTDFSYTRKVSKSVCKGQPLAKPRGGNVTASRCRLPPQCPKGHVPPY